MHTTHSTDFFINYSCLNAFFPHLHVQRNGMNFQDFMYTTSKTEDLYTHLVVPETKRDMVKFITEKGEMYDIHLNPLTLYKGIQIVPKHVFPMTLPTNDIVYQNGTNIKHADLFVETPEQAVIVIPRKQRSSSRLQEQKRNILDDILIRWYTSMLIINVPTFTVIKILFLNTF